MPSYLTDLDQIKHDLEARYPGWQIWYVPGSVQPGATWCARPHPLLNAASPEDLAEEIEEADRERDAAALASAHASEPSAARSPQP
jgi:hypothetical protein